MKKNFVLLLLAVGLAGCESYNRAPYAGRVGNYGFTFDLDNSPSPFVDTSYRPLTAKDLMAPMIIIVTNQPLARNVHEEIVPVKETFYFEEFPSSVTPVTISPTIIESAGAEPDASVIETVVSPPNNVSITILTNTNGLTIYRDTNVFVGGTSRAINEPSGTQLDTNRPSGEPQANPPQEVQPDSAPPTPANP